MKIGPPDPSNEAQCKAKNLTDTDSYKTRIGRPGRKSSKLWKSSEEIDGKVDMCLLCFCNICSQGLPRPIVVWYGFADMDCAKYWRELTS